MVHTWLSACLSPAPGIFDEFMYAYAHDETRRGRFTAPIADLSAPAAGRSRQLTHEGRNWQTNVLFCFPKDDLIMQRFQARAQ
jgi:hypothetical protein